MEGLQKLQALADFATRVDKKVLKEEDFLKMAKALAESLNKVKQQLLSDSKEVARVVSALEKRIEKQTNDSIAQIKSEANKSFDASMKEQNNTMNFMRDKMRQITKQLDSRDEAVIQNAVDELQSLLPSFRDEFLSTPEETKKNLESLQGNDRLHIDHIDGVEEKLEEIRESVTTNKGTNYGVMGRDFFSDIDISDQLDGSTKTFNIPAVYNILEVSLSSYPHALRKSVDFTYTPTTITFTDEIDAATSLAAGQTCVLTVVIA